VKLIAFIEHQVERGLTDSLLVTHDQHVSSDALSLNTAEVNTMGNSMTGPSGASSRRERKKSRNDCISLYVGLNNLKNYASLNYTGMNCTRG
jgi:hypothetical protein